MDPRYFLLFFIAAFALALASTAFRIWRMAKYLKAGATMGEAGIKEAMRAEAKSKKFLAVNQIFSRIGSLVILGFLAFFFATWMQTVARDWMVTTGGQLHKAAVYGFLAGSATVVILRGLAMLLAPLTNPMWIDVVADPQSKWANLEKRLLLLSFGVVFTSIVALIVRIMIIS